MLYFLFGILNPETGEYDDLDLEKTYYLATNDFFSLQVGMATQCLVVLAKKVRQWIVYLQIT